MTPATRDSLARSALKIAGTVGLTAGVASAIDGGALLVALFSIVGTAVMAGLGWSHWEHNSVGGTPVTLRTLAPDAIPADVSAKMKENQT